MMKLAILTLFVLAVAGMASGRFCYRRTCAVRTVYFYPECCPSLLHRLAVRYCYTAWHFCGRKRSVAKQNEVEIGFPCNFTKYDTNNDKSISFEEFMAATELPEATAQEIFKMADKNKNGGIDCKEFLAMKVEFDGKPKCNDKNEDEFWNGE